MEKHKCKLCTRTFANGRALGGHMKAHLATLPLPPKPTQHPLPDRTESASSSYSSEDDDHDDEETEQDEEIANKSREFAEVEEKTSLGYGLRENPKKSFRLADPEFSFAVDAGSVVQDRESETESRNPTRTRSKRTRTQKRNFDVKKAKFLKSPSWVDLSGGAEPEPVSSVSDTSPEEDVAMCLMMLSRDVWMRNNVEQEEDEEHGINFDKDGERSVDDEMLLAKEGSEQQNIVKVSKIRGKFRCEKCMKLFRSSRALSGHKRICSLNAAQVRNAMGDNENERIFECPYCFKVFGSGQALGGHKRSHLMAGTAIVAAKTSAKLENNLIDLNLPAPVEDDDFSVVSDA